MSPLTYLRPVRCRCGSCCEGFARYEPGHDIVSSARGRGVFRRFVRLDLVEDAQGRRA